MRAGEIVGLYGLIGAGRSEFVHGRFTAASRRPAAQIFWQGEPVDIRSERDAIGLGIALAPESRRDQGLCLNLAVGLNLNLPIYKRLTQGVTISRSRGGGRTPTADPRPADQDARRRDALASSLSGGNQQKIVIGKWLNHGAKLFIFDEPTVGVDVGTKAEIYRLFADAADEGRRHHPDLVLPAGGL